MPSISDPEIIQMKITGCMSFLRTHAFNKRLLSLISSTYFRYGSALFGSLVPALVPLSVLVLLGFDPAGFHPFYSDEVHYWNEISTISHVGFGGGYSVINEVPAKVYISTFGPHGPAYPMALYPYASIMGWSLLSPFIFNALFVTTGAFLFLSLAAQGTTQKILATLFLGSSFSIILFIPTGMQESLHQGLAILLAAYAAYVLGGRCGGGEQHRLPSTLHSVILLGAVCLAAFIRPSWAVLYALCIIPVLEAARGRVVKIGLAMTAILVSYGFMYFLFAPTQGQGQLATLLSAFMGNSQQMAHFFEVAANNATHFFDWEKGESFPATLLRYEMLLLLVVTSFMLVSRKSDILTADGRQKVLLAWLILASSILSVVLLYEVGSWRDFRTLAPGFIAACLILVTVNKCSRLMILVVLIQIVSFAKCIETFDLYRKNNFSSLPELTTYKAQLDDVIAYAPNKPAWCNTLLVLTPGQESSLLVAFALQPGIGISVVHKVDTLTKPVKSQYVLLDEGGVALFSKLGLFDTMEPVASLIDIGLIYKNKKAKCD